MSLCAREVWVDQWSVFLLSLDPCFSKQHDPYEREQPCKGICLRNQAHGGVHEGRLQAHRQHSSHITHTHQHAEHWRAQLWARHEPGAARGQWTTDLLITTSKESGFVIWPMESWSIPLKFNGLQFTDLMNCVCVKVYLLHQLAFDMLPSTSITMWLKIESDLNLDLQHENSFNGAAERVFYEIHPPQSFHSSFDLRGCGPNK